MNKISLLLYILINRKIWNLLFTNMRNVIILNFINTIAINSQKKRTFFFSTFVFILDLTVMNTEHDRPHMKSLLHDACTNGFQPLCVHCKTMRLITMPFHSFHGIFTKAIYFFFRPRHQKVSRGNCSSSGISQYYFPA